VFVLLSRAVGLPTRLVHSMQPVSFKPSDLVFTTAYSILQLALTLTLTFDLILIVGLGDGLSLCQVCDFSFSRFGFSCRQTECVWIENVHRRVTKDIFPKLTY